MNIGEKIKQTRIEKNISIENLAELINDNVENIIKLFTLLVDESILHNMYLSI